MSFSERLCHLRCMCLSLFKHCSFVGLFGHIWLMMTMASVQAPKPPNKFFILIVSVKKKKRVMPIASLRLMSLDVGIWFSPCFKTYIWQHRVETKLHFSRATGCIQVLIKPRSSPVPLSMEPFQIGDSGWYAIPGDRGTTFSIVDLKCAGAFPLFLCASGNPACTSVRFKADSWCDACAFQRLDCKHK